MEAQREVIKRQHERFEFEIEMLGERILELEKEKEEGLVQGHTRQENSSIPKRHTMEKEIIEAPREENNTPAPVLPESLAKQRSYATVAASKPAQASNQSWTKVSYGNRKTGGSKPSVLGKGEYRGGRRILFLWKDENQLKPEANLILALNEALQKGEVEPKVRFSRVRYAPSGSILVLLTEKADAAMLRP